MARATGLFHATLICWDLDRAERFYREVLGIGRHATPSYFPGEVVFLDLGNAMIHLTRRAVALFGPDGEPEFVARQQQAHALGNHVAIEVDDLAAALARVQAAGRPILQGPLTRADGMRCFYFADTEQNRVELVQH